MVEGWVITGLMVAMGRFGLASVAGDPDKRWREGPVRYVLAEEEYRRYGTLETPAEREAFVERFWEKRDPDPSTVQNEFRDRFEALCTRADRDFVEPFRTGWRTDRGRVLILLGEPDSIRRDAGEARGRDREIWTFLRPPGGGGAPLEILFYRNHSGQFVLSPEWEDERLGHEDPVERETERQHLRQQLRAENLRMSGPALEQLTDLLMGSGTSPFFSPEKPKEPEAGRDRSRMAPDPGAAPGASPSMSEATYFFQSADGSVLVLLALEFRPPTEDPVSGSSAPAGSYAARAWIADESGGAAGTLEAATPTAEVVLDLRDGSLGSLLFVGRTYLKPGPYILRFGVLDAFHRSLAVRTVDLNVPHLAPGRFSASSVVPAERFGKAPDGTASPFAVGSEEVVPRPGGRFRRGEPLRIYLQVYDAAVDPLSSKPRVDVKFQFQRATRGGYKAHGKSLSVTGAEGASMGLALPVGDWPSGEYRVVVDLRDRVSGARTETSGSFSLAD